MENLQDGKLRVAPNRSVLDKGRVFGPGTEIKPNVFTQAQLASMIDEGALIYDGFSAEQLQHQAEQGGFDRPIDMVREGGSEEAPGLPTFKDGTSIVEQSDQHLVRGERVVDPLQGDAPHTPEIADKVQRLQDQAKTHPHSVEIRRPAPEAPAGDEQPAEDAPSSMDDLES